MIKLKSVIIAFGLMLAPLAVQAQAPAAQPATAPAPTADATAAQANAPAAAPAAAEKAGEALKTSVGSAPSDPSIGQPIPHHVGLQKQVTANGQQAAWMHDYILMPVMVGISILVLGLLLFAMTRFRRKANPTPSSTTHNTMIEVIWTLVPVLILVGIAVPSIKLIAAQFEPAPKDAVTVKAVGNQWFWTYELPDHGVAEYTSNMLSDADAKAKGEPRLLGVDNRLVIPVNTPIRLITTANDVIHSWAVPAFWIKIDSVPGRINEVSFKVEKEGVYYGQCSELCGIKHGFMPIAVEVVSKDKFAEWVRAKGGKMPGDAEPAAAAPATAPTPVAAPATPPPAAPAPAVAAPAAPVAATK